MESSSYKTAERFNGDALAEMSEFSRLFGFRRPEAAMQDIVAKPSCLTPLAIASVASIVHLTVLRPQQLTWTPNETVLAAAGTAAAVILRLLMMAGFLTAFAATVSHLPVSFKQVFAIVSYSACPESLSPCLPSS